MVATFYVGDALEVMAKLPEKSVDLVLSSPPFLALRSYLPADHPDKAKEGGSQATPGEYIDWLVDVAEACARVLAPHGSLCFELGDTYAGSGGGGGDYLEGGWREGQAQFAGSAASMKESNAAHWRQKNGKKDAWPLSKSLSLIPELFRLTLVYGTNPLTGRQTDRWRLRNVIRWVRPNPPVGALGDKFRPATSELMVFCKSAKRYFDLDAVREPHQVSPEQRRKQDATDRTFGHIQERGGTTRPLGAPRPNGFSNEGNPAGAPPLDWWNIPPGGYEGAHYAVFPPELCVRPIKAMSPEQVCRTCGEPRRRIVETQLTRNGELAVGPRLAKSRGLPEADGVYLQGGQPAFGTIHTTLGFTDCGHDNWRPGLVLDPFAGSGTTLAVATGHGRQAIGIDLDERNFDLALERVGPMLLERGEVEADKEGPLANQGTQRVPSPLRDPSIEPVEDLG